ncbi:putative Sin3 binding protein-domain-containing protein [Apodospora peruviana]|uniref:Sin3 binding protein-domain-containing protein n=1 Tax=Apodospora peruviana TaxID=516989 RepID=A0AAE0ICC2_9PEZI|nr:putative Sin3 binding protein-domain-containing protein [Apodospora peruviana]
MGQVALGRFAIPTYLHHTSHRVCRDPYPANLASRTLSDTSRSISTPKTVNMATMASAVRDIATTSGRDNLTAVAARSVPVTTHPDPLPTPPNSISPTLPPHGLKAQLLQRAKLNRIDSDLDLQDGQDDHDDDAGHPPAGALGSPPYDAAGAITPAMLAKYHLPEILLNHGPLAIRHIMGYLTTSVPGFAGIPPAKARRLVVGALERHQIGREGCEGAGLNGDVEFDKVGWGQWDAKRRGEPARHPVASVRTGSPASSPYPTSIPISKAAGWSPDRRLTTSRLRAGDGSSIAAFSHDDRDITMLENEADKMSMDGSASASCSEAPDDDVAMNDDSEDLTDDEDWAVVGAAALRASSYQAQSNRYFSPPNVHTAYGGVRSFSGTAGMARAPHFNNFSFGASALGAPPDAQERDAVEALLRLGSV